MKLLDDNVFLRLAVEPRTEQDVVFNRLARRLLDAAQRGEDKFMTSEAVIAEVLFVLTSKTVYGFSRNNAYSSMIGILQMPACHLENRNAVLAALDLWVITPQLSFVDALCMTKAKQYGYELVTFDTALAKAAGTQRWDLRSTDDITNTTAEMP
jgi:predicted nucleic acid-binding protein